MEPVIWSNRFPDFEQDTIKTKNMYTESAVISKPKTEIKNEKSEKSCLGDDWGNGEKRNMSECTKHLLPVKDALDILSGKWKIQIIISLTFGKKRFKEIQREIPGITAKMLSKELRELEINELATRKVYDTKPVTVEYELTPYGRTLKKVISELHDWGSKHRKRIIARGKK